LLGLYNFHRQRNPVPVQTINFEVLPSGIMKLQLQKETHASSSTNGSAPTLSALFSTTSSASNTQHVSPSGSPKQEKFDKQPSPPANAVSAGAHEVPGVSMNLPWWHPSAMAAPAAQPSPTHTPVNTAKDSPPSAALIACRPAASFLFHVGSGHASLIKHSRSGKPKLVTIRISSTGEVSWHGKETVELKDSLEVTPGRRTRVFEKSARELKRPLLPSRCFSIIMPNRTLDLEVPASEEHLEAEKKANSKAKKRSQSAADAAPSVATALVRAATTSSDAGLDTAEQQLEQERDAWVINLRRMIQGLQSNRESLSLLPNPALGAATKDAPSSAASAAPSSRSLRYSVQEDATPTPAFDVRSPRGRTVSAIVSSSVTPSAAPMNVAVDSAAIAVDEWDDVGIPQRRRDTLPVEALNAASAPAAASGTAAAEDVSRPPLGWRKSVTSRDDALLTSQSTAATLSSAASSSVPLPIPVDPSESDSGSDSDSSDSEASSSSNSDSDDSHAEQHEKLVAQARMQLPRSSGANVADEAESSEDEDQSHWETWEDPNAAASDAAAPSSSAAPAAEAGSAAIGEDSALASLLRLDPLSAVRVPQTIAQLLAGPAEVLAQQLRKRDQQIAELQATVRKLNTHNEQLQMQLRAIMRGGRVRADS
jgi:hypothetical protein